VARREWTRQWWAGAAESYELVTSTPVLEELAGGRPALSQERVALIRNLPRLPVESAILEIIEAYIRLRVKCDFLVTWNCRHLANANKFGHVWPYSPGEYHAGALRADARDAIGIARRK
jgi:hypothetical protein